MLLPITEIEARVAQTLERNKVSARNAASVAVALVASEAAGQGGHGLRRLAAYCAQAKVGKVDGFAEPTSILASPGGLQVDAAHGFAYPAFDLAVEDLSAMARRQGIAFAAIRRSHHAGVMGLTVERFAERGLAAMMFANAPAAIAPWGGRTPLYGTNPIAFAAPLADADPIVVDLAMSKVARGKIMAAQQKGIDIPLGWAFDKDGNPTTNATLAMQGTMMPLGEAKGAALALMVEILAAGLTGSNYSFEASSLFDDKGSPPGLGQMIIAIDPKATGSNSGQRLALLADEIGREPGVRLPGRRGQNSRREALARGIEVEPEIIRLMDS